MKLTEKEEILLALSVQQKLLSDLADSVQLAHIYRKLIQKGAQDDAPDLRSSTSAKPRRANAKSSERGESDS
jgi:hypothetical protein